jgi:hypothetical protein
VAMLQPSNLNAFLDDTLAMDGLLRVESADEPYVRSKSHEAAPTVVIIPVPSEAERPPSPLSCPPAFDSSPGPRAMSHPLRRNSAWDTSRVSWSKSSRALGTNNKSSACSSVSLSSSCSDEDLSRESVDLEEDRQRAMLHTVAATANTSQRRTGAAALQETNVHPMNSFTAPLYPRQRSLTEIPDDILDSSMNTNRDTEVRGGSDANDPRGPFRSSGFSLRAQRTVTAHSRRNLLILFLVAVYTTFGLTTPNIPEENDLIFPDTAAPAVDVVELHDSQLELSPTDPTSRTTVDGKMRGFSASEATNRANNGAQSKLSFARGRSRQMLTFRRKEITDFYHQKALQDETSNLSWYYYLNCTVLVAIAVWAWRERSVATSTSSMDTSRTQLRSSFLN